MNYLPAKLSDFQGYECSKTEPYSFDINFLKETYKKLIAPRIFEEKMLILLRQGKISKWFSGIGQEAIEVGAVQALDADEYVVTIHRNLGAFLTRNVPVGKLFSQFQGKLGGYTQGRDRSYYCGCPEEHVIGTISHIGNQFPIADGLALASKLKNQNKVTLVLSGDGGTSTGDFHEALNLAAVWDLPVIFLIENNGYALSTPTADQYNCKNLADYAVGYGIEGVTIDGNNVLEVYQTVSKYAKSIRKNPRPVIIEAITFRMRGHEESSGNKYVSQSLLELWQTRDPILQFERSLLVRKIIDSNFVTSTRDLVRAEIEREIEAVLDEPEVLANTEYELSQVFHPEIAPEIPPSESKKEMRTIDAISDGLKLAMEHHDNLILMGQDIAEYGGAFKITDGFLERYGKERVRNTPVCESAEIGCALGLSIAGFKSVVEMQFSDFVTCGFNQIVNNLAKINYRWGQAADVVIRMPCGAGVNGGPFHSQSNEAWFMHTPGLKIAYPAFPADAKGLLISAIMDKNPAIFFEHKKLYRSISEYVPEGLFTIPFGKANVVKEGEELSIITYGLGVHWALSVAKANPDLSIRILDLRTLAPLDWQAVSETVQKTSRVIVLHEANMTAGVGAEISAYISEHCYQYLDAPVMRVAGLDTPVPFSKTLEENFLADSRLEEKVFELLSY